MIKAIFELVVSLSLLLGGSTYLLREVHDVVRRAALEQIAHGMPSLEAYTQKMTGTKLEF